MARSRPSSPSPSARSARSFLDEDPYPSHRPPAPAIRPSPSVLEHLESLLRAKAEEIQLAGQLGASLLQQQAELEARIGEIAVEASAVETDSDGEKEVGEETKRKLAALEEDLKSWDEGNSALYASVSSPDLAHAHNALGSTAAALPNEEPPRQLKGAGLSQSVAAGSRRARNNAQHRTNDIELATEIGQSLLTEVRRLQALLAEKDELVKEAEAGKDAAERAAESAELARKGVEETVDKYKEENWNLELATQELRASLVKAQATTAKAELDRTRLTKDLAAAREAADVQRAAGDALTAQLEALKARHETDMATMRKHTAGLQRDKSDLQGSLDGLKTQLALKSRAIPRVVSAQHNLDDLDGEKRTGEDADEDHEDDVFRVGGRRKTGEGYPAPASPGDLFSEMGDDSPAGSPIAAVQRPGGATELDTLRATLAHAQRTIAILKSQKRRVDEVDSPSSKDSTPLRTPARSVRGSARGGVRRGRGAGPSRLGRQVADDHEEDGEEEVDSFGPDDAGSIFEHHFPSPGLEDDLLSDPGNDYDSPLRRTADMEQSDDDDNRSIRSNGSGVAVPTSLAGIAGLLSNGRPASIGSLGMLKTRPTSGMFGDSPISTRRVATPEPEPVRSPPVVWADASTMTEPLVMPLPPPKPEVVHVGVQASPIVLATTDFAGQTDTVPTKEFGILTDPVVLPATAEMATATDVVLPPAGIEMQVQTEPLPEPTTPVAVPLPLPTLLPTSSHLVPSSMEDRALGHLPSLSDLTSRAFPGLQNGKRDSTTTKLTAHDSDAESESTDRALETETETDGEFEDARESIGAASPVPTLSATPTTSIHDFHSIRSARTHQSFRTANDSDADDFVEVLRTPRVRQTKSKGSAVEAPQLAPEVVEAGVQTDAIKSSPAEAFTPASMASTEYDPKRDSIRAFGRPDSGVVTLEPGSAAILSGGLLGAGSVLASHDRPLSPGQEVLNPDPVVSNLFQRPDGLASFPPQSAFDTGKASTLQPVTPVASSTLSMPPPSRVLSRPKGGSPRKSAASMASTASLRTGGVPPRPTSPPPPDLLYRAQSPSFDQEYERRSTLLVPGTTQGNMGAPFGRGSSSTLNVRTQNLRPQTSMSMSEYTSASTNKGKNPIRRGQHGAVASSGVSLSDISIHSDMSRRLSMASSRTSEGGFDTPVRNAGDSTDPIVIHAITQTMIGEFLHKYTRRTIGKGISEKRHKRFFWVHPYTKTLYWSTADPGAQGTAQSSSKSVFIEGVRQVLDPNPNPPGLHQGSIIIKTPNREMKITAPTRERHDMWFNAIKYLLGRPDVPTNSSPRSAASSAQETPARFTRHNLKSESDFTPVGRGGMYNLGSASDSRLTPKGGRSAKMSSMSTFKRTGTAAEEFERHTQFGSPQSLRAFSDHLTDESIEVVDRNEIPHEEEPADDGWEGLENVRVCCGKHDVGSLSRHGHQHHHHRHHHHTESESAPPTPVRPRSKSSLGTVSSAFSRRVPVPASPGGRKSLGPLVPQGAPLTPLPNNGTISRKPPTSAR